MTLDEIREAVGKIHWFHQINLGRGIVTPGDDISEQKVQFYSFPESFEGKTVLDIGAWNGAYSFEAERRGAKEVLATDHFCWSGPGPDGKPGFDLAKKILESKVRELDIPVEQISVETVGAWDYVLFLGVFYHLPDPILPLKPLYSITRETLIFETVLDDGPEQSPAISYYGGLDGQPRAAKFVPNKAFVLAALRDVGFRAVEIKTIGYSGTILGRSTSRGTFHAHR